MKKVIVTNVDWDLEDVDDILVGIPKEFTFDVDEDLSDEDVEEYIGDALSDMTGWCHYGFEWQYVNS